MSLLIVPPGFEELLIAEKREECADGDAVDGERDRNRAKAPVLAAAWPQRFPFIDPPSRMRATLRR
jgi:hypothetical protein